MKNLNEFNLDPLSSKELIELQGGNVIADIVDAVADAIANAVKTAVKVVIKTVLPGLPV
ncbi:hypothetical protein [Dyadobacter flavalbus]|uniref:hypothetical protein n=1 Tax=Dyadobacter flavalbus TaxID=2579942 RepID=UPI001375E56C|nr:hypothetical protein [Dyadobacter flavalbus]